MSALERLARFRRRRRQRGAALFIVVMVIVLLMAIGVFSARSASMVDVASGFNRQAIQTQYVTEYGTRVVVNEFGVPGNGESILKEMQDPANTETCEATKNVVPVVAGDKVECYRLPISDLAARIDTNFAGQTIFDVSSVGTEGSLGPPLLDASQPWMMGTFQVEITDPGPPTEPEAGSDVGGGASTRRRQFTLTGTGQTRPFSPGNACNQTSTAAAGVQTMRAIISAPGFATTGG